MLSGSLIHYTRVGPAGCSVLNRSGDGKGTLGLWATPATLPYGRGSDWGFLLPLDPGIHRVCGAIPNTFMDQIERFQLRRKSRFPFSSPLSLLVLLAVVVV